MKPDFKGFANEMVNIALDGIGIDGGDIQDVALRYGLLKKVTANEACGEDCDCAQYDDFPMICHRKTYRIDQKQEGG